MPVAVAAPVQPAESLKPSEKMKKFNWKKVNLMQAAGKASVWYTRLYNKKTLMNQQGISITPDYAGLEEHFQAKKIVRKSAPLTEEHHKPAEIELIEPKRANALSMFLGALHTDWHILIKAIKEVDQNLLTAEKALLLQTSMPTPEEIPQLTSAADMDEGQRALLSNGDKFLLALIDIPGYHILVDCIVQRYEYKENFDHVAIPTKGYISQLAQIIESDHIDQMLCYVLDAGNFINGLDRRLANATGYYLNTFDKLRDVKSAVSDSALLHFVVADIQAKNPQVFEKLKSISSKLAGLPEEIDENSLTKTTNQLKQTNQKLSKAAEKHAFKEEFADFFLEAATSDKEQAENLEKLVGQLDTLKVMFDEKDEEEIFKMWRAFLADLVVAEGETERRRIKEETAAKKAKEKELKEEQHAKLQEKFHNPDDDNDETPDNEDEWNDVSAEDKVIVVGDGKHPNADADADANADGVPKNSGGEVDGPTSDTDEVVGDLKPKTEPAKQLGLPVPAKKSELPVPPSSKVDDDKPAAKEDAWL